MCLPDGFVLGLRAPAESTAELNKVLQNSSSAVLRALRAQERERLLDITGAEEDWKRAADLAVNKAEALNDLAGFYGRRNAPNQELQTLLQLATLPAAGSERFRREENQPSWHAFERAAEIAQRDRLSAETTDDLYQSWIERYSKTIKPYTLYLDVLTAARNATRAQALAACI